METPNPNLSPTWASNKVMATALSPGMQRVSLRGLGTHKRHHPLVCRAWPQLGTGWGGGAELLSHSPSQQVNEFSQYRAFGEPVPTKQHGQSWPKTHSEMLDGNPHLKAT